MPKIQRKVQNLLSQTPNTHIGPIGVNFEGLAGVKKKWSKILFSVINFSYNDSAGECLFILESLEHYIFSFNNQRSLLFHNDGCEVALDWFIACRSLSDDKVQEDDACNQDS